MTSDWAYRPTDPGFGPPPPGLRKRRGVFKQSRRTASHARPPSADSGVADSACTRDADIGRASSLADGLRSLTINRDTLCSGAAPLVVVTPFSACLAVTLPLVFAVDAANAKETLAIKAPVRPSS